MWPGTVSPGRQRQLHITVWRAVRLVRSYYFDCLHYLTYLDSINAVLRSSDEAGPSALDLFAGCGGLALGFEAQGFQTHGFEMDADCGATYWRNLAGRFTEAFLTPDTELPR